MKKVAKIAVAVAMAGIAGGTFAANPGTFNITANMGGALSVLVVGNISFPNVAPSTQVVSSSAVVVTNDSSGFVEDYELSIVDNTIWDSSTGAAGADAVGIRAQFNTVAPAPASFVAADLLLDAAAPVSGNGGASFSGDQDADNVTPSEANNLWIRLDTPTTDSTSGAPQSFTVTVNAINP